MSKHCPHCGGDQFKAVIKRPGIIKLEADGTATILKEATDKFNYEVAVCFKCNAKVSNDDLVDDAPCSQCNMPTPTEDLVDGLCQLCVAMNSRPELATASKEDILRRLLAVEKLLNSKGADKVEAKVIEANQEPVKKTPVATATATEPTGELSPQQKAAATRKANEEKKAKLALDIAAQTATAGVSEQAEVVVNAVVNQAPNLIDNELDAEGLKPPAMPSDDPF